MGDDLICVYLDGTPGRSGLFDFLEALMISTYESIALAADYLESKHRGDFLFDIEVKIKGSMSELLQGQKQRNENGVAYWRSKKSKKVLK